jgi:hypothetical protein
MMAYNYGICECSRFSRISEETNISYRSSMTGCEAISGFSTALDLIPLVGIQGNNLVFVLA